jgi:hypothetical protein
MGGSSPSKRVASGDDFQVVVILNWLTEVREKLRQAGKC